MTTVIRADAHSVASDFLDGWLSLDEWQPPVHLGQLVLGAAQAFEWMPLRPDRHRFSWFPGGGGGLRLGENAVPGE